MPSRVISHKDRYHIWCLRELGFSFQAIADRCKVSVASAYTIYQKISKTGSAVDRPRNGRPTKVTPRMRRWIVYKMGTHAFCTIKEVVTELYDRFQLRLSAFTVRSVLRKAGYRAYVKPRKPQLSKKAIAARMSFAKKYLSWSASDWENVIFSDESKFSISFSTGRVHCWRRPGDQLCPHHVTQILKSGGGSIFVWGCMTSHGIGYLTKINDGLDAKLYVEILNDELKATYAYYNLSKSEVIFQHDNDPKHTAKLTKAYLEGEKFQVLDWPPYSPDLNPIEHLWIEVKRRLKALPGRIKNRDDLWQKLEEVWDGIDKATLIKLYHSMPQRIQAVYNNKGSFTRW